MVPLFFQSRIQGLKMACLGPTAAQLSIMCWQVCVKLWTAAGMGSNPSAHVQTCCGKSRGPVQILLAHLTYTMTSPAYACSM